MAETEQIGNNDVVVAKELGYLRKASEDNSKQIDEFKVLLSSHMTKEDSDRRWLNNKLTVMFVAIAVVLMKDTGASGLFSSVLHTFFPLLF